MAKRKTVACARKRQLKCTKVKATKSDGSEMNSNLTSVSNESSPSQADWLNSIQTDHVTYEQNMEKTGENSPLLTSFENGSVGSLRTLEIQINKLCPGDFETPKDSTTDGEDVDECNTSQSSLSYTCQSPKNGLEPNKFYGSKLQSFNFSFRKSPNLEKDVKKESGKLKNGKRKGKSGSVKRKHKGQKGNESVGHAVKKTKKDDNIMNEKEFSLKVQSDNINEVSVNCSKDVCSSTSENKIKDHVSLKSDILNDNKDFSTDVVSSSTSPMSEEPLCLVRPNGLNNGKDYHHNNVDAEMKEKTGSKTHQVSNSCTKSIIDEVVLEFGSLHSEDSLTSGLGSVKSCSLLKGQNNEYYFTTSSESSPDLNANGPSKLYETPKSTCITSPSITSPDIDIGSEDSCAMDNNKTAFLFCDKEISESSYSPSCHSTETSSVAHISPEHQTSITSFFKTSSKQVGTVTSPKSKKQRTKKKGKEREKKMEQMYLDLGQRDFGHVTCVTCGMVYTCAQPDDEIEHIRHHKKFVNGLRFNGWKDEHVVKEFHDGRIIMVKPDDHPSRLKKVDEIRKVVDSELGFAVDLPYRKNESKTFLFIASKRVVGCCVATQINKGYPVLPSTPSKDNTPDRQIAAWCCSTVPVPAQCGISKIWVWNQYRRKKVATRLIDCARSHFIYGCTIAKEVLAFSDPTPDGKRLATSYIGTTEFLVFR